MTNTLPTNGASPGWSIFKLADGTWQWSAWGPHGGASGHARSRGEARSRAQAQAKSCA